MGPGSSDNVQLVGLTIAATLPEPSPIMSLATGLAGMAAVGIYRRRRLRKGAA
jgi:hypothetical protein